MISDDVSPDVGEPAVSDDGGPPLGFVWTLVVSGEDGWSADLEHAAPLPRVGELIEFIAEDGHRANYRVVEVVHTVQRAASERPPVREERTLPNSIVTDAPDEEPPREVRAGLPRVVVEPVEDEAS